MTVWVKGIEDVVRRRNDGVHDLRDRGRREEKPVLTMEHYCKMEERIKKLEKQINQLEKQIDLPR